MCNEKENTTFYNNENMLRIIGTSEAISLMNYLDYLFWDTSTFFISQHGMATNEDVASWIEIVSARKDLTEDYKNKIIEQCKTYIG